MEFTDEIEKLIFDEFLAIEKENHQERIRYYERNRKDIVTLDFDAKIIIELKYAISLYEVEEYYSFLEKVDGLINIVISENIHELDDKDVFKELVYMKAEALHKTIDYYKAEHVYTELVRMDSEDVRFTYGFKRNAYELLKYKYKNINALSVLLFIVAAIIVGVELLMVRSFYPQLVFMVETVRNVLFFFGVGMIAFFEGYIRLRSDRELKELTNKN